MPIFELKPWEGEIELEICGSLFCVELRDKGDLVRLYYEEYNDKRGEALMLVLVKKEGYKEYVEKFAEFDLPEVPIDSPNEKNAEFYTTYKSALDLYNEGKRTSLYTKWEEGGMTISLSIMMFKRVVDVDLDVFYSPYRLHYNFNAESKRPQVLLAHRIQDVIGLYTLFEEYVRK
ncbi:hypothetical protein HAV1_gp07 [Hyperthermophilic Archaeal Virus 1]|uniref:hypothetical protein n=1 Tax=Hyperthermophilic Archaeal Virus 1 TaxID=762905 RepID=UPI0001DBADF2|nr:hypothetical protein HAV1_gp07 [Hyperthermophilic Archaeal Virus 1]ADJ54230.1 hypothetical protein HAV1_gp07 [Hyperthermophilic Archaeal Virus 1]